MAVLTNTMMQGTAAISDEESYQIEKSLRFNRLDGARLNFTPTSTGNRRVWTYSTWLKIGNILSPLYANTRRLLSADGAAAVGTGNDNRLHFQIGADGTIAAGNGAANHFISTYKFNDPSAWYHIVLAVDTTRNEEKERILVWVNGELAAWNGLGASAVAKNTELPVSKASLEHDIGRGENQLADQYLAETYFIDGYKLNPACFGKFDDKNIWQPRAFTIPTPNDGTTWSSTVTTGGASLKTGTFAPDTGIATNLFAADGTEYGTWTDGPDNATSIVTWKPPSDITADCCIRIGFLRIEWENGLTFTINGQNLAKDMFDQIGTAMDGTQSTNVWFTAPERTITAADGISWQRCSGSKEIIVAAIEVDGVLLRDGITDVETRNNLNDGRTWSSYWSATTGTVNSSHPFVNSFDGSVATRTTANTDSILKWVPPTTITAESSIELYMYVKGTIQDQNDFKVNNVSKFTDAKNTLGNYQIGWYDIGKTIDSTNGIQIGTDGSGNDHYCFFYAMRIDGHILVDGAVDNSFHLKYNDVTSQAALGADSFGTETIRKPGGFNEDANKDKLVLAVPGDVTTDVSPSIRGSGSAKSAAAGSGTLAAVSTSQSRFYGSSINVTTDKQVQYTDGTDFDFGTGDCTIEAWVRSTSNSLTLNTPIDARSSGANGFAIFFTNNSSWQVDCTGDSPVGSPTGTASVNTWYHIALSRVSGYVRFFVNGQQLGSTAENSSDWSSGKITLGHESNQWDFNGFINDLRVYKGVGKYTGSFHPPVRNDWTVNNLTHAASSSSTSDVLEWDGGDLGLSNPAGGSGNASGYKHMYTTIPDDGWEYEWVLHNETDGNTGWFFDGSTSVSGTHPNQQGGDSFGLRNNGSGSAQQSGSFGSSTVSMPSDAMDGDPDWYFTLDRATQTGTVKAGSGGTSYSYTVPSGTLYFHVNAYGSYNYKIESSAKNLTTTAEDVDSLVDTPTSYSPTVGDDSTGGVTRSNYCTLNPIAQRKSGSNYISTAQGNLLADNNASAYGHVYGTMAVHTSGKWYFECTIGGSVSAHVGGIGLTPSYNSSLDVNPQTKAGGYFYGDNGQHWLNGVTDNSTGWDAWVVGDVLGVKLDLDSGTKTIQFLRNNTVQGTLTINDATLDFQPCWYDNTNDVATTATGLFNFGQRAFKYAQTGYSTWCTKNLSDTFSGTEVNDPSKYVDVKLWNGSTAEESGEEQEITGLGFKPDLVWIKSRSKSSTYHYLYDAVRGGTYALHPNVSDASSAETNTLKTFDSNGFTLGDHDNVSGKNRTHVGWCWDVGSAANSSGLTDGTTDISAGNQWVNATSGLSITKYTGNSTDANASSKTDFAHNLGVPPEFILGKAMGQSQNWCVYHHKAVSGSYAAEKNVFYLNTNDDFVGTNNDRPWGGTAPTNTLIYVSNHSSGNTSGSLNYNGEDYICYAWAGINGFSKFGGYDGNGSHNFLYLGFRPKIFIQKCVSNDGDWEIFDTERTGFNNANNLLYPCYDNAEAGVGGAPIFLLSNGISWQTGNNHGNGSGRKYVYAAWAESPFKTSRAR